MITRHLQVKWGVTGGDFCCGRFLQTNQVVIIFVHFLHVQFPTGRNGQSIVIEPNQSGLMVDIKIFATMLFYPAQGLLLVGAVYQDGMAYMCDGAIYIMNNGLALTNLRDI